MMFQLWILNVKESRAKTEEVASIWIARMPIVTASQGFLETVVVSSIHLTKTPF